MRLRVERPPEAEGRRFESAHPDHPLSGLRTLYQPAGRRYHRIVITEDPAGHLSSDDEEAAAPIPQMPIGIVIARITVVSAMSFAGALAIFFLVGGLWLYALVAVAATLICLLLMFAVERGAA